MDMVGRNHPDSVVVVGKPYTTLGEVAEGVARDFPELRLVLADDPDPSEMVFFRSDQLSFAQAGIPAIFFTTWLHDDYHLPSDTPDLILAEKMERLSRLVFHLSRRVADAPERPRWTAEGEAVLEMLR
jgi:Zn-dependent M28 family amino/carboxypeptidase